jgi:hypothetical protein
MNPAPQILASRYSLSGFIGTRVKVEIIQGGAG